MDNLLGSKIKNQQVLITKAQQEIQHLSLQKKDIQESITLKERQLSKYKDALQKLKVTTQDIKTKIACYCYCNGTYSTEEFTVKVVDNVVVTILDQEHDNRKKAVNVRVSHAQQVNNNLEKEAQEMIDEYCTEELV